MVQFGAQLQGLDWWIEEEREQSIKLNLRLPWASSFSYMPVGLLPWVIHQQKTVSSYAMAFQGNVSVLGMHPFSNCRLKEIRQLVKS